MAVEEQAKLLLEEVSSNARYFSIKASRLAGRHRMWTAIQTGSIAASIAPLLWEDSSGRGVIVSIILLLGALLSSIWSLTRNHAEQFAAAIWASDRCDQIGSRRAEATSRHSIRRLGGAGHSPMGSPHEDPVPLDERYASRRSSMEQRPPAEGREPVGGSAGGRAERRIRRPPRPQPPRPRPPRPNPGDGSEGLLEGWTPRLPPPQPRPPRPQPKPPRPRPGDDPQFAGEERPPRPEPKQPQQPQQPQQPRQPRQPQTRPPRPQSHAAKATRPDAGSSRRRRRSAAAATPLPQPPGPRPPNGHWALRYISPQ